MASQETSFLQTYQPLTEALFPHAIDTTDGSHDISHIHRVLKNAGRIHAVEGGTAEVVIAATILHDCVSVEKSSPLRSQASRLAAAKATRILQAMNWSTDHIGQVAHAIEAHSFSAGITPMTLEAKIVQDADRLDAIGMVGVARLFYVSGRLGRALYDVNDPEARERELDDTAYSLDHFQTKILKLASGFLTATGKELARIRHERVVRFLEEFSDER